MRSSSSVPFVKYSTRTPWRPATSTRRSRRFDIRGSPETLNWTRSISGKSASATFRKVSCSMCGPVTVVPFRYWTHIGHCRLQYIVVSTEARSGASAEPS
jgi:hypothetical protein